MKLLVLSDLHLGFGALALEIDGRRIDDGADVIVLAGDIDEGSNGLAWARQSFPDKPIVYVAGNHEFYDRHFIKTLAELRQKAKDLGIHFLENDSVEIDGIRFLGCTLWTNFELLGEHTKGYCMQKVVRDLNDYTAIRTTIARNESQEVEPYEGPERTRVLKPLDTLARHQESRAWLEGQLANGDPERTVVVTHHAPSKGSVSADFLYSGILCAAYASDLEMMMGRSTIWIHGHLHTSSNYMVNGTRVLCNPRGYWSEWRRKADNKYFKTDLVVDVS